MGRDLVSTLSEILRPDSEEPRRDVPTLPVFPGPSRGSTRVLCLDPCFRVVVSGTGPNRKSTFE